MARLHTTKMEAEVGDLLLDRENPRTGTVASQSEALEAIVRLNFHHFRNMMLSIKANDLDPGDSFYVIENEEESDSFVVVDGNRRLAALKVLYNPALLDGTRLIDSTKKRLKEAAVGFSPVQPLSCVLFESRADANEWIERRHGKNLEGEGRISWGSLESDRFQKDRTVLDVISFVERNSLFEESEWVRIRKSVEKNPTTLRRFLVSKAGKQHIGFVEDHGGNGPAFRRDPKFVLSVLSKIFSDIDAGDVNSRSYNKASEIAEYFSLLPTELSVEGQSETTASLFAQTSIKDGAIRPRLAPQSVSPTQVKTKKVTPLRQTLAPNRHTFAEPANEKGKQLLREASKLKLRETPLGCAFLFRAWLEFTVETEMRQSGLSDKDASGETLDLKGRFGVVFQHLIAAKGRLTKPGDLTPIKMILTTKGGAMSFGALNGYVHSHFQKPSPDDIRNAWDSAIPLFVAVYGVHK
ncbi:MAG: hypothetical protein O9344_10000 [Phreatobacter sp.]|nr:hypothetical protein [Phreatobacter sp.]